MKSNSLHLDIHFTYLAKPKEGIKIAWKRGTTYQAIKFYFLQEKEIMHTERTKRKKPIHFDPVAML